LHGFRPEGLIFYSDARRVKIEKGLLDSIKLKIAITKGNIKFTLSSALEIEA